MFTAIDHLVITTKDIQACLDFYQALGFEVRESAGRYELLADGFKINVHLTGKELDPHAKNPLPGSADFCLTTTRDLQEILEAARKNNLDIVCELTQRMGFRGSMSSIYLRDPDGNLVEISKYLDTK